MTLTSSPFTPITEIIAAIKKGEMVILIDDEDRENEGDLVIAADFVSADAINFMAKHGRGLICLTLTEEACQRLQLPLMSSRNGSVHGTNFTVSIEAAQGVTTGISASDRAHTIRTASQPNAQALDIVSPGHIFPLQAKKGGVLVRAGHTEAGCDLASIAGCTPASVICEIMQDDGTMARLPALIEFAKTHQLKIGTIAELIRFRSENESLIQKIEQSPLATLHGQFTAHLFQDTTSLQVHCALTYGDYTAADQTLVRVHYPTSFVDLLRADNGHHAWGVDAALRKIVEHGHGVALLMHCASSELEVIAQFTHSPNDTVTPNLLRTYGIGAQILRALGVRKMISMGQSRKMPSFKGFGLEVIDFL